MLERVLTDWQDVAIRRLTEARFSDLLDVGRLQGEITALRRVLGFVNNRADSPQEGA